MMQLEPEGVKTFEQDEVFFFFFPSFSSALQKILAYFPEDKLIQFTLIFKLRLLKE